MSMAIANHPLASLDGHCPVRFHRLATRWLGHERRDKRLGIGLRLHVCD